MKKYLISITSISLSTILFAGLSIADEKYRPSKEYIRPNKNAHFTDPNLETHKTGPDSTVVPLKSDLQKNRLPEDREKIFKKRRNALNDGTNIEPGLSLDENQSTKR